MKYKWLNEDKTVLSEMDRPDKGRIIDIGNPDFAGLAKRTDIAPYIPLVVPLEVKQGLAKRAMVKRIEAFTKQFTDEYSLAEIASWPTQSAEARSVKGGGKSVILNKMAEVRGISEADLAAKVEAISNQYMTVIGTIAAIRSKAFIAIDAATTSEDVQGALDASMADAVAIFAAMEIEF